MTAAVMASATSRNFFGAFRSLFCACLSENNDDDEELEIDQATLFQNLIQLEWLDPVQQEGLLWRTLEEAMHETISQKVSTTIEEAEDYSERESLFGGLLEWTSETIVPWIEEYLEGESMQVDGQFAWKIRLEKTAAACFCEIRMASIFDIVADYPDSLPDVHDLRLVLGLTGLQSSLAVRLQESLQRRLCHPGANTSQIIDVYINTIKVLRVIDPSDRLLSVVAEPVRQYLRGRADTVRSIIGSLTGTTSSDLYQELRRQDAKPLEDVTADSDDDEECPTMDWLPPPSIHQPQGSFLPSNGSGDGTDGDILAMLVSIYGSKELFVNEYRLMLADKLLANLDYNVDQEVHTLELLKLRFGETSMRSCEVMLKDLNDSKRTNTNIRSFLESQADTIVDAVMLSHIFWPQLHDQPLKHHPKLQYMLEIFQKEYGRLKNPRVLIWFHQLGTVELEAEVVEEVNGQSVVSTKEFSCSPLLATLLAHFEDKPEWTTKDLSNETGIPEHLIQKRMAYWVNQRVVRLLNNSEGRPTYVLTSVELFSSSTDEGHSFHEATEGGVSVTAQEEEEMDAYISYIVGMLTNLGSLPLKTIHNNLKTFVTGSEIRYNKTPQQLSAFLQRLCKEERLECGPDGMYKLFKK
jgi:anaphase-promoting complex subunit 2